MAEYNSTTANVGITSSITFTKAPTAQYVSNLSDGINTYVIKDSEARAAIAGKQDTSTALTTTNTYVSGTTLYIG